MHTVFCTSNTYWQKDRQIHTRTHAHTHTHTCTRARIHTHTHARPHIHTPTTGGTFNFALTQIYLTMWGAHSASLCWKMQSTIGVSSPSDGNGTSLLVKCDCHSTACTQIHALVFANTKWDFLQGKCICPCQHALLVMVVTSRSSCNVAGVRSDISCMTFCSCSTVTQHTVCCVTVVHEQSGSDVFLWNNLISFWQ